MSEIGARPRHSSAALAKPGGERAMTASRRSCRMRGVVSPYTTNANPYITPVWRDCTPARLSLGVSVLTTNQRRELLDDHALDDQPGQGDRRAEGVTTAALGPNRGSRSA